MLQNLKSLIIWTITLPALVVMGMAFYPAISESMSELVGLFENPMMKTMLGLFAMGPEQLSSLSGFYITYASIYVILMGGIFAAMTAIQDVAGEFRDKTAEFLLTRPVSRSSILLSKWLAIELRILIMVIVLSVVTVTSFSVFSKSAPLSLYKNSNMMEELETSLEKSPEKIKQVWTLDDDFFMSYIMATVTGAIKENPEELDALDVSNEVFTDLLDQLESDPDRLFVEVLESPEKYMDMFDIPSDQAQLFTKSVKESQMEFETAKERFANDPDFHLEMYKSNSELFLNKISSIELREKLITAYPEAQDSIKNILKSYSAKRIYQFHVYIFLFMSAIASMSIFISIGLKQAKNASSLGIGLVLVLYFFSTLTKISPQTAGLSFISPFGLIDQNITGGSYQLDSIKMAVLFVESITFMLCAMLIFNKKDIAS